MAYRAGAHKKQGFEKGMGEKMEDGDRRSAEGDTQHHITQLADGGISQNFFNIPHHECNGGGKNCGKRADYGHYCERGV